MLLSSSLERRPDNYHPKLFVPSKNRNTISVIDDHKYKLTFKSYCLASEHISNGDMISAAIAIDCKNPLDGKELDMVWEIIHKERWKAKSKDYKEQGLTDEEIMEINEAEKDFDLQKDFDAYAPDFLKSYGIDLYEDDVELFKFFDLLFALLSSSSSCISKRRSIRNYKPSKDAGVAYNVAMQQSKEQFSL